MEQRSAAESKAVEAPSFLRLGELTILIVSLDGGCWYFVMLEIRDRLMNCAPL